MKSLLLAAGAALALSAVAANATPIAIVNSSFEVPVGQAGFSLSVAGWGESPTTDDEFAYAEVLNVAAFQPITGISGGDGAQALFTGAANGSGSRVFQNVGAVTSGANYTLSALVAGWAGPNFLAPGQFTMEMGIDDGGVFNRVGSIRVFSGDDINAHLGEFGRLSYTVHVPDDVTGEFQIRIGSGSSFGGAVAWDAVTLDCDACAAQVGPGVPEPASWALMLAGFGGLGAMFRGRRAAAI